MTDFCEYTEPTGGCHDIAAYVTSMVTDLQAKATIRYGEGLLDATDDDLDLLWYPCDPPACAVAVWYNSTDDEFTIWGYTSGSWSQTGTASKNTPYYTEFEGVGGPVQEGWVGDWVLDGDGAVHPTPVLSGTELLDNGDMETWTLATSPDDWSTTLGAITEENTLVESGLAAAKMTVSGPPGPAYFANLYQQPTVTEARWLQLSAWIYGIYDITIPSYVDVSSSAGWLAYGSRLSRSLEWEQLIVTDFSISTLARIDIEALSANSLDVFYSDNASVQEITDGWFIYKNFYSDYGTFYVDFTLESGSNFGILLNYVDEDNYAMVVVTGASIYLVEVDTGAAAITNSWAYTYVAGARLEVIRDSSDNVTIDYNSVNIVTNEALVTPISSTLHGIIGTSDKSFASAFGYTPE